MSDPSPIKLFSPISSRDGDLLKDSRLYNGFAEKAQMGGDEVWVYKRPGLFPLATWASGQAGRGVFNWKEDIYAVFGGTLYKNAVAKGSVDPNGVYTFTACLGAVPQLFLKNTAFAYVYDDGGGLIAVSSGDYPGTTVPGCVYLDGTTYVCDPTSHIQGDDFNDQTTWDPLNVILAQIEPDEAIAIAKQLVYVVVLKKISTEVFYDAGNATGSPLAPVQGSKMNWGCRAAGTVCDVGGDLMWVGTTRLGSIKVLHVASVKGEVISTPPVEKALAPLDYSVAWAWAMDVAGHRFYVVTLPNSNLTLVFDLTAATWYIWTDAAGNYLPIVSSSFDSVARPILQHATNGKLYSASLSTHADDGVPFPFTLYTENWDGGQRINKTNASTEIAADRVATSLGVAWSDDDYQTFTTPQQVSLDQERPMLQDGSTFRRRAYKLTNQDSTALRIKALLLTATAGTF